MTHEVQMLSISCGASQAIYPLLLLQNLLERFIFKPSRAIHIHSYSAENASTADADAVQSQQSNQLSWRLQHDMCHDLLTQLIQDVHHLTERYE